MHSQIQVCEVTNVSSEFVLFVIRIIVFILPEYVLITLTGLNTILSPEMVFAFIPLSVIAPICAELVLTYKKSGRIGVKKLLKRSFDYKREKSKVDIFKFR